MSLDKTIPIVLVSGFLGSGKTTFLNKLFNSFPSLKFGIIINDFGELGVDASLIKKTAGSVVTELNNGQIFCSCLAGSFIKAVSAYAEIDIDYLLVETSGLAKPSPLLEIIEEIKKLNGERFSYHGMISLVDSGNYLKLSTVLKAVDEQISYSDIVLLNKIDTTDAETLTRAEMKILSINPDAEVIRTEYGHMAVEVFLGLKEKSEISGPDRRYAGWGEPGRPVPLVFKNENAIRLDELKTFIDSVEKDAYRMKGLLQTDEGLVYVDSTVGGSRIKIGAEVATQAEGLVVILPADDGLVCKVKERAFKIFTSVV